MTTSRTRRTGETDGLKFGSFRSPRRLWLLFALCTLSACDWTGSAVSTATVRQPRHVATAAPFVENLNLAHRSLVRLEDGTIYIARGDAHSFTRNTGVLKIDKAGRVSTLGFSAERVAGNSKAGVYFLSKGAIFKLAARDVPTLFAGRPGLETDNFIDPDIDGPGATARFSSALDIAVDANGDVLVQETVPPNFKIRKIDTQGLVSSYSEMSAKDLAPSDNWAGGAFAVDRDGAIYLGGRNLVRRVEFDGARHKVKDISGGPYDGHNSLAFSDVSSITVGGDGAVYFRARADGLMRLSKSGEIDIVHRTTHCDHDLIDGNAAGVGVCIGAGFDVGSDGAVYFVDETNNALRRLGVDDALTTIVYGSVPPKW